MRELRNLNFYNKTEKDLSDVALISTSLMDLGIRTLKSVLENKGFSSGLYLLNIRSVKYRKSEIKRIIKALIQQNPEVIGISTVELSAYRTRQLIKAIKNNGCLKDKMLVVGGIHATLCPRYYIDIADAVFIGEAEVEFPKLVEKVMDNKEIYEVNNLWIRKKGRIKKNKIESGIKDLNKIPFPSYSSGINLLRNGRLIKLKKRFDVDYVVGEKKSIFLVEAKGCSRKCSFCIHSTSYQQIYRKKSLEKVVNYLKKMRKKSSLKFVYFMEDDFFLRSKEEISKFARIYKNSVGLPFFIYGTSNTITDEKVDLLVEAGLKILNMGIQTGSERINELIYNRPGNNEKVLEASKILNKYANRINLLYDFIISNPYESKEDLLKTINLIRRISKPFDLHLHYLVFFEGTSLYEKAINDGIIDESYSEAYYDFHSPKYHLKKDEKFYLNSIITWMNGHVEGKRYGLLSEKLLKVLFSDEVKRFFERNRILISFLNKILPSQMAKRVVIE